MGLIGCSIGLVVVLLFLVYRLSAQLRTQADEKLVKKVVETTETKGTTAEKEEVKKIVDDHKKAKESQSSWITWATVLIPVLLFVGYYLISVNVVSRAPEFEGAMLEAPEFNEALLRYTNQQKSRPPVRKSRKSRNSRPPVSSSASVIPQGIVKTRMRTFQA